VPGGTVRARDHRRGGRPGDVPRLCCAAGTSLDDALSAPGARRASVRPGDAAGIRFTLDDPCLQAAFPFGPTTAVLEATALGITRTVALALDPVPLMMSTTDPPDSCR
jgi:hypothetical protein